MVKMKKSELRQIIKEELSKVNESYASSFGGSRNEDWEMVKDTLIEKVTILLIRVYGIKLWLKKMVFV